MENLPDKADPYAAWRQGPFRLFISGRAIFLIGTQMQNAAVGWEVYERLGTKLALAYVGLVQILPVFFLTLPAGHLADRADRKKILLSAIALYLSCSVGLAWVSWKAASPFLIYTLLFFLAVARAFAMPAMGSLLPNLLPRKVWGNAATWNSTVFELTGLVGPALGGFLIAASGHATVVYAFAACSGVACFSLFQFLPSVRPEGPPKAATWRSLGEGLRFMFRTRILLAAASLDLFAMFLGGAVALLPVVAKDILHVGPHGFGWLRAAPSIGAMAMAFCTAHLPPWRKAGRVLFGAFIGFGAAMIVFGLSHSFWLSFSMLVLTGLFDNLNVVIRQTLIQFITPDSMRGRVTSVNFLFIGLSNELGEFESGLTAQWLGTAPAIVLGGIGTVLVALLVMRLSPPLRRLGPLHEVKTAPAMEGI
ncbi:MAG: MFS transporter [Verrucomicrobium sp.]|nr:MFS transporter [Verrucomicrobium sp.]